MQFLNDEPPGAIFKFEPFGKCKDCALARAWLLRVAHRERQGRCVDAFIALAKSRQAGSPDALERAGMVLFADHGGADRKQWFTEIWEAAVLPESVITIV